MTKKDRKSIKGIAEKLPPVIETHASGGEYTEEDGLKFWKPNLYKTEVNHERRLRRAYQKLGMDGVHAYLDSIRQLQNKHNEKKTSDISSGGPSALPESD